MIDKTNLFLGNNPEGLDKMKARIIKPVFLKDSSFAYDLWEWKINQNSKKFEVSSLYYKGLVDHITSIGYFKRQIANDTHVYIKLENNIIHEVTPEQINDELRTYISGLGQTISFENNGSSYSIPRNTLENIYLKQHHNMINKVWLTNLQKHETPILKDTELNAFFVFENGFVTVSKDGVTLNPHSELKEFCIWKDQMIRRNFQYIENRHGNEGKFEKFIHNVCNHEHEPERLNAMKSGIGYLLHNHHTPSKGQAVILYDEALTSKDMPSGGTGKGLIVSGIKNIRQTAKIDGKNYKSDDKFKWSNISPSTQLVWIDETNKNFNFDDLFSCLTDGWQIERKHQNKFDIAPEDSPKVVICSNTILNNHGSSNKRRQFIIELSDYYSKQIINGTETPIQKDLGILFSSEWDCEEWNKFYSFMMDCTQYYLKNGLVNYQRKNVELNLLKQQTCDEFLEYIIGSPIPMDSPFDIKPIFEEFKSTYFGIDSDMKQRTFTNWIKKYALSIGGQFKNHGKSNGNPMYIIQGTREQ
jgi:hypothetical protein